MLLNKRNMEKSNSYKKWKIIRFNIINSNYIFIVENKLK